MGKLYVYSTLSSDMAYTNHAQGGADIPVDLPPVFVKGGAGVANDRLITPRGVATEITDEQAEYLRANKVFQLHEQNGYVQISDKEIDADKAAADMTGRDQSAPMVPQDFTEDGSKTVVGGVEADTAGEAAPRPKRK